MKISPVPKTVLHVPVLNAAPKKASKTDAGYVHRIGTDYRCIDCWKFIAETEQCAEYRVTDSAKVNGTCTEWSFNNPLVMIAGVVVPNGALSPEVTGYTEDPKGTKCIRCAHFDPLGFCERVDEKSIGDDPGEINPNACCRFQKPK